VGEKSNIQEIGTDPILYDRYGLLLTTASAEARDAYIAGVDCLLAANAGVDAHFRRAIEADRVFALPQIGLARALFLKADVPAAREASARARTLAESASLRERSAVNAIALAIEGKVPDSLAATRAHVAEHPRDALVLSPATGVFGLIGFSGRQEREAELYDLLAPLAPHYGADWWFDSMLAFAACESGRLDEASRLIERGMAANPRSAHGAHVKAHVLYEMGEARKGLEYLDEWMPGYAKEGLMHCHLSWHVALFALKLGEPERAWQAYRAGTHPGGSWGPPLNIVSDTASFLWRAELLGVAASPELWKEARDYALKAFPKAGVPFADVHTAVACAASGDFSALQKLVAEMNERLAGGKLAPGGVVPMLAEGFGAYARKDWNEAIRLFEKALPETVRIGGSRAQRDLVERTLAAAYQKAGRADDARKLLARRPA
jgi:tetratricopeptide (TPR) repeat protein